MYIFKALYLSFIFKLFIYLRYNIHNFIATFATDNFAKYRNK